MIRNLVLSLCAAALMGSLAQAQSIDGNAFDEVINRVSERSNRRGHSKETRREMRWVLKQLQQLKQKHRTNNLHQIIEATHLQQRLSSLTASLDATHSKLQTSQDVLTRLSEKLAETHPSVVAVRQDINHLKTRSDLLKAELKALSGMRRVFKSELRESRIPRDPRNGLRVEAPSIEIEELEEPIIEEVEEEAVIEESEVAEEEAVEEDAKTLREDVHKELRNRVREITEAKDMRAAQAAMQAELEHVRAEEMATAKALSDAATRLDRERAHLAQAQEELNGHQTKALKREQAQLELAQAELHKANSDRKRSMMQQELEQLSAQIAARHADIDAQRAVIQDRAARLADLEAQLADRSSRKMEAGARMQALQAQLESLNGLENRAARRAIYEERQRLDRKALHKVYEQARAQHKAHRSSSRAKSSGSGAHRHRDLESQLSELRNEMQEFRDMLKQLRKKDPRRRSSKL